jgi:DNA-binding CsgD family transcriptional regulator
MDRGLSEREKQVIGLLMTGCTNKEIGARLTISKKTVEFHLTRLYELYGCAGRVQLALIATKDGFSPSPGTG